MKRITRYLAQYEGDISEENQEGCLLWPNAHCSSREVAKLEDAIEDLCNLVMELAESDSIKDMGELVISKGVPLVEKIKKDHRL